MFGIFSYAARFPFVIPFILGYHSIKESRKGGIGMLDRMNQLLSLGLGMAVVSKEQVEKAVNRLVEKGNLTKAESKQLIDELLEKGEQSKQELNEAIKERVNQILSEMNVATKDEIKALELRIQQLEERLNP